jgi:opacity protein-like surface antigen
MSTRYEDWNLTGSAFAGYEWGSSPVSAAASKPSLAIPASTVEGPLGGRRLASPTGDTTAFTGMVNAYVDADLGAFRPFAGVGLGMAQVNFNDHGTVQRFCYG